MDSTQFNHTAHILKPPTAPDSVKIKLFCTEAILTGSGSVRAHGCKVEYDATQGIVTVTGKCMASGELKGTVLNVTVASMENPVGKIGALFFGDPLFGDLGTSFNNMKPLLNFDFEDILGRQRR